MGALTATHVTLLDWARRVDPDGKIASVIEVLNEYNEILDDISFVEGNLPTGHKVTVRASLPTPTWRLLNQGVVRTKSTSNQITETCGMMEAYSEIDKDLAMLNGNTSQFRFTEDLAHIEAMNQAFAETLIYGDTSVDPEKFVGLAPRYYTVAGATTSGNLIDGGGVGTDNTSVWLVGWSPATIMGIFPKGSKAGLQITDLGEQTVLDSSNNPFQAYRTHFQWKCGIAVKDWRYVVRIPNIDISTLETAGDAADTSANLLKMMSQAMDKLPPSGMVRPIFYCNNRVRAMIRVKFLNKSNTYITLDELQSPVSGLKRPTLSFMGIPIRRIDQLDVDEARIT
ncbi:hypothetical protein D4R71_00345 [bacterium]|nr:MAG: hypothetical protein D4R71_00345 [bacterium]